MTIKKFRWSRVYESSEEELLDFLQSRNVIAERITAEALSEPVQYNAEHETTIWCAEGSMTVQTGTSTTPLQPGDAVRLDGQQSYSLIVGISGYTCYISA